MKQQTERAEAGTREAITAADRMQFKGVAQHPLARRWMVKRFQEAQAKAAEATTREAAERWSLEVERVGRELRRHGVKIGVNT